jgi:tetratricopeptide (TPR) repeat protein
MQTATALRLQLTLSFFQLSAIVVAGARSLPVWARSLAGIAAFAAVLAAIVVGTGVLDSGDENVQGTSVANVPPDQVMREALNQGDWASLQRACEDLLARDPFDARAIFNHAYSLHRQGRLDEAAAQYRSAADFQDFSSYSRYNLACILARQGQPDEAMQLLTDVIESGFCSSRGIGSEIEFKPLRVDPEFLRLMMVEQINRERLSGGRLSQPTN